MTADDYYINFHKEMFEKFYPLISDKTKQNMQEMIKQQGYSMLAPTLTLFISSLSNFNSRNLTEMLKSHEEIESSMNNTPYIFPHETFIRYFSFFDSTIIPLLDELEKAGFYKFWQENKLPLIKARCEEIDKYMEKYNAEDLINQYKNFDNSDFTVYLCSFANPHGIGLCANSIISDYSYPNDTILSNVTHEIFHPPYNFETVKQSVNVLAEKSWVKEAFKNQNPNSGYYAIEGFIEEHIVEALGIYILSNLGIDIDPIEYFKNHDEGSHVISPYFYKYLCENKKDSAQSFEDYFIQFVDTMSE
jgi:hypothetical protein